MRPSPGRTSTGSSNAGRSRRTASDPPARSGSTATRLSAGSTAARSIGERSHAPACRRPRGHRRLPNSVGAARRAAAAEVGCDTEFHRSRWVAGKGWRYARVCGVRPSRRVPGGVGAGRSARTADAVPAEPRRAGGKWTIGLKSQPRRAIRDELWAAVLDDRLRAGVEPSGGLYARVFGDGEVFIESVSISGRECGRVNGAVLDEEQLEAPLVETLGGTIPPSQAKSPANGNFMEAAGIEPASADAPVRASTSVVRAWISPDGRGRTPYRRASQSWPVAPPAIGSPSVPSPFVDAAPRATGRTRSDASPNWVRRRVRDCRSHLRWLPVDLRGLPATSACSSAGESTTSKPGRPRMSIAL